MRRREFVAAMGAAGLVPWTARTFGQATGSAGPKDFYELRVYSLASAAKQKAMETLLAEALAPAWRRALGTPVGLFKPAEGESTDLYALLVHKSLESVAGLPGRLMADAEFLKAASALLEAPMKDPLYQRIESSLLLAFDAAPRLETPSNKDFRVFQLRIYESHNEQKAVKKVQMFNEGGEVAIFRRVGMPPVFFGQALVGPRLPNLTYMLGFDDMDALNRGWEAFRKDDAWLKLKVDPQYADTVSNITNVLLRPAPGSQV